MSKAVLKEGPRAPLFYLAAALLLLSAKIATAQTVELATLEMCAGLETQELKLACFEAIIASSTTPDIRQPEAVDSPLSDQPVAEIGAVPDAVEPAVATSAAPENPPVAIEPPPADHSQVAAEVAPVASVMPAKEDFGREQLAAPDQGEEKQVIKAIVVDVTQGSSKLLYFRLANGQVWRQIEPRRFQYPKQSDFEVSISEGFMSEYRLRIGDNGRMVRIRRVE
jgi:hypothetical protein